MNNPLQGLPRRFSDLTTNQEFEVIQEFDKQNNFNIFEKPTNRKDTPKKYFEKNYFNHLTLIAFFNNLQCIELN